MYVQWFVKAFKSFYNIIILIRWVTGEGEEKQAKMGEKTLLHVFWLIFFRMPGWWLARILN